MKTKTFLLKTLVVLLAVGTLLGTGCGHGRHWYRPTPEAPLGAISDEIWQMQEHNAEAADFVLYQHEFELNGIRLNNAAEDHVKQIAERLLAGQNFPVVVERSDTSARPETELQYPVHPNPELDMRRREVVVRALALLGVPDADARVVVAPRFDAGFKAFEAVRAYNQGFGRGGGFGGGLGVGGLGGGGF
jgi:hypothetical protein